VDIKDEKRWGERGWSEAKGSKGLVEFWEEKGEDWVRVLRVYTRDCKLLCITHIDLL